MTCNHNRFTFNWILENINFLPLYDELLSPSFTANSLYNTKWQLGFIFKEDEQKKNIAPFIRLWKITSEPYNISLSYTISLFDDNHTCLEKVYVCRFWFHRGNRVGESVLHKSKEHLLKVKTIECCMHANCICSCIDTEHAFGRTHICFEKRYFKCEIENFSQLEEKTYIVKLDSQKCPSKSINLRINTSNIGGSKVQIGLRINFENNRCGYYPHMWISSTKSCLPFLCIQDCKISLVDTKENVMILPNQEKWKMTENIIGKEIPACQSHDKYFFRFQLNSENKELAQAFLKNDSLTFQCECDICFGIELNQLEDANSLPKETNKDFEKQKDCKIVTSMNSPTSNFMNDMQQLFAEKQFCDFNLKTETEIFSVHRAVLSARSPVLKAMFSHDMRENANKSVDIPDLTADTVKRMLMYIYTDMVDDITWKEAFDLYTAGDKYGMLNLKERCWTILKSNFHPSSICEILICADEHHNENLKQAAQDYIIDHDVEVMRTDSWENIKRNHPILGIEILNKIVVKKQED